MLGALAPLKALACGWLALLAAESWNVQRLKRLLGRGRLFLLLIPAILLGFIGSLAGAPFALPLACVAIALDPDAVRHGLSLSPRPDAGARFAPSVAAVSLGLALLASLATPLRTDGSLSPMPGPTHGILAIPLGVALGILSVMLLRLAEGRPLVTSFLIALPLVGWGLAARTLVSPLAVLFLTGVVLANEGARRDLVFTVLAEHERRLTMALLIVTGAGLVYDRGALFDPTFWFLTSALVLARPLAWRLAGAAGLSSWDALPISPLALPLGFFAASGRDTRGSVGGLSLAAGAASLLCELAWAGTRERRSTTPGGARAS